MSALVVLDTPALYYRSFYALPTSIVSPAGVPVNAVRGLLDTVAGLIDELDTTRVIAALDADWRPAFRTALLPQYKAQRITDPEAGTETPEELLPQLPLIRRAFELAGIPVAEVPGTEADDVIGSIAAQLPQHDELIIVSPDRDLIQVLREDRRITLLRPQQRGAFQRLSAADLPEAYGVATGAAYRQLAALRGDPSDGLPGVPGIGEKTAAKLLSGYGGLAQLLRAAAAGAKDHGLTPKRAQALREAEELVLASEQVMTVKDDLDIGEAVAAADATASRLQAGELLAFGAEHGVERSAERLVRALAPAAGITVPPTPKRAPQPAPQPAPPTYKSPEFEFRGPSWTIGEVWGFDLETTGVNPHTARIVSAACVRLGAPAVPPGPPAEIRTWLADPGIEMPAAAEAVHGMSTEYVQANGADRRCVVRELLTCLEQVRARGGVLVGHNILYDLTVLESERKRLELTPSVLNVLPPTLDTLVIDRRVMPRRPGKRTLFDLCLEWVVPVEEFHNASADALAAARIMRSIANHFPDIARASGAELHSAQKHWKREQAENFQAFLRSKGRRATINPNWPVED